MKQWYKAATEVTIGEITRCATGYSSASLADAQDRAKEAARKAIDRANREEESNDYPYGVRPLAEPILREWRSSDGALSGLLSVNSRGCVVLNTAGVMFVDVDLPKPPKPSSGLFGSLFGKKPAAPVADPAQPALAKLHAFVDANPGWGFHVYRTAAGLRYLCNNALHDPSSSSTLAVLAKLGSDPLYIRLCEKQECFRARLTPKPSRVDKRLFKRQHAHSGSSAQTLPVALAEPGTPPKTPYETKAVNFAVCTFLENVGDKSWHPEAKMLAAIHDEYTRPTSGLPLA